MLSITEISIKNSIGKLATTSKAVNEIITDLNLTVLPFTAGHAHNLFELPLHHCEPFDRMIIATALSERIPLIGGDLQFKKYTGLKLIWK